jgi:hypothetical protein
MNNIKTITKFVFGTFMVASLGFSAMHGHAAGFNKNNNINDGKVYSSIKFYDLVEHTKPSEVAKNFGTPDEVLILKAPEGEMAGVVWIYRDAVLKQHGMQDARFVLINGELKYVTLSDAT